MFDIGFTELVVIFIVALLAFGPKRLPEIAKAVGRGISEIKKAMEDVKTQIDSEVNEVNKIKDSFDLKNELDVESLLKPVEDPYSPQEKNEQIEPGAAELKKDKV